MTPQRKEAPLPTADLTARGPPRAEIPSGVTSQLSNQHASRPATRLPDMAARESSEARDAGQPVQDLKDRRWSPSMPPSPPPPPANRAQTAGHAGVAPSKAPARRGDLWIDRITTGERRALAVSIGWLLTSHSRHREEGTCTMADVAFGHRAEAHASSATIDHPSQWHYMATWLIAHMGTYSLDELNGLDWLWHRRAALRIRTAMQRHNIWAISGSRG